MNVNVLIDAIVRQTMVLIAHLATAGGARAPLTHVANQVFLNLVDELKAQGLGQKVIADMFGMALRTYHARVRRLSESATDRGRSLWEAMLTFIQDKGLVTRADVMSRFSRDDEATVRGVLNDLVDTALVFRTGRGDRTSYRAATAEEMGRVDADGDGAAGIAHLVWVAVNRLRPVGRAALAETVPMPDPELDRALDRLIADGRIRVVHQGGVPHYDCDECVIPFDASAGWEAALFDHYQAVVSAICAKLRRGSTHALPDEAIGGSTYGFDVWDGHPLQAEVLGLLANMRRQASRLRAEVDAHNATTKAPPERTMRVMFYAGQTVIPSSDEGERE